MCFGGGVRVALHTHECVWVFMDVVARSDVCLTENPNIVVFVGCCKFSAG